MLIKTLLFDLDDTLFEYDTAFDGFLKRIGVKFDATFDDQMSLIHEKNGRGYAPRVPFFDWLAKRYSLSESGEELWRFMKAEFSKSILVTEATKKMLREYSDKYTIGILTNGSSLNQRNKLRDTGLSDIVSNIYISGEFPWQKPEAEMFHYVCKELDTSPNETLYIGDHWKNDIVGAKRAGLKTCWLRRATNSNRDLDGQEIVNFDDCDFVIASLDELYGMLASHD